MPAADRPRLIHRTHVQMIIETPSLKDGTGKEIRRLHDKVQQHLRALKAMRMEPPGPFITSVLELMFEWQKHPQGSTDVPPFTDLLEFLNMRAQASETHSTEQGKVSLQETTWQLVPLLVILLMPLIIVYCVQVTNTPCTCVPSLRV